MGLTDYSAFRLRRPRHPVSKAAAITVRVERPAHTPGCTIEAELLDLSREGFRVRVPTPLESQETIVLRIRCKAAGIDLALSGVVRWQKAEGAVWQVGCVTERPTDWETLGELFLNDILSTDSPGPTTG